VEDITAVLQHCLDEMYLVHSSCYDLYDLHQTPKTPESQPEEEIVCRILDMDGEATPYKWIEATKVFHVAFPVFSSAFCVIESCLCCNPCKYSLVWVKL
jgi:hypothetical protein